MEKTDLWSALAAPLVAGCISWRQDGRAVQRDGRWFARFVAYVDANTVRERLDAVVPGEWDLTLDLLPPVVAREEDESAHASFKARLQILGVIREDVGTGRDYKAAATDAFKRAAVRFGIGHELYAMDPNWVQVDGEGRFAKPLEDPQSAYERRVERRDEGASRGARGTPTGRPAAARPVAEAPAAESVIDTTPAQDGTGIDPEQVGCPKCGGRTWDNRLTKRNPKAPDFKCRDRACDGVVWPARTNGAPGANVDDPPAPDAAQAAASQPRRSRKTEPAGVVAESDAARFDASPLGGGMDDDDDLPF